MNVLHGFICRSRLWRRHLYRDVLPEALRPAQVRPEVLELGPGPGEATAFLLRLADRVTVAELDPRYVAALATRFRSQPVTVVHASATRLPFQDAGFATVSTFTMLHHVPTVEAQDEVLSEAFRVLQPGGLFCGSDSVDSLAMRVAHLRDTMVLVPPDTFAERLAAAGFEEIEVRAQATFFSFQARKPQAPQ